MRGAELIDEIDWLIFELQSGAEISIEHYASFDAMGIEFPYATAERARFGGVIRVLKHKRERLI